MPKKFKLPKAYPVVVAALYFIILIFAYNSIVKTIPVSYWDEFYWVGKSYFFDLYIKGDFKNRVWQSSESYDQPKLGEYAFGAWLYPTYLKERGEESDRSLDYTKFLIKNGFYEIDESYLDAYSEFKKNTAVIGFNGGESGFPDDFVRDYGQGSLRPINLIYRARTLNVFLLALAVIIAYFFVLKYAGPPVATIFFLFYGLNPLIIDWGLKAHSEALFLLTFNAAIFAMSLYFTKGRKTSHLIAFSVFAGLCFATKLNGVILVGIFFVLNLFLFIVSKERRLGRILQGILSALISVFIFVALNPFTFSNPIQKIKRMFDWRTEVANAQSDYFKEAHLADPLIRLKTIFENFYFSESSVEFNGIKIFERARPHTTYESLLIVPFVLGLLYSMKSAFKKNTFSVVVLVTFILTIASMSYYLILDWERYYIHLVLFFVLFQSLGLRIGIAYLYNWVIRRKKIF